MWNAKSQLSQCPTTKLISLSKRHEHRIVSIVSFVLTAITIPHVVFNCSVLTWNINIRICISCNNTSWKQRNVHITRVNIRIQWFQIKNIVDFSAYKIVHTFSKVTYWRARQLIYLKIDDIKLCNNGTLEVINWCHVLWLPRLNYNL
jgi:hypothetical protein